MGKVIPGVSGSLIAVSLNVYEEAIEAIGHFFNDVKKNIYFLGSLGIGLVISIAFGSKILIYMLEFCYVPTMLLFIGFIIGIFPNLYHKIEKKNKKTIFLFLLPMLLVLMLPLFSTHMNFYPEKNMQSYIVIFGIGFLDAMTMVIPGISGTAIFILLGCYSFVLNLFSNLTSIEILTNFSYYCFFGIGLALGVILVSKIMSFLYNKYKQATYTIIMGFTCASVILLIVKVIQASDGIWEVLVGILLAIIGYFISICFGD